MFSGFPLLEGVLKFLRSVVSTLSLNLLLEVMVYGTCVVRLSKLKEFASNSDAGVVCILRSLAAEAGSSSVSVSELN